MFYSLFVKNNAPIRYSIKYKTLNRCSVNLHPGPLKDPEIALSALDIASPLKKTEI